MCSMDDLPDSLLFKILDYLPHPDVVRASQTCWRLHRIAGDELLWKRLFHRYFGLKPGSFMEPCHYASWRSEFIRLLDETPRVEVEVLKKHTDQVLHVSFSHDGKRFATSAKDGYIVVWRNGHPCRQEYSKNMKYFSWKYTQFSQFNESDTMLLVSGVLFGHNSTSGEITVFSLKDGFQLQCRVMSKPYDIFGTWYSDSYFLSGQYQWLENMVSRSVIWLNKSSQESQSEHAAIMNELYRFYNPKASSCRSLTIANCISDEVTAAKSTEQDPQSGSSNEPCSSKDCRTGNPLSNLPLERAGQPLMQINSRGLQGTLQGAFQNWKPLDNIADIQYTEEFRKNEPTCCLHSETSSCSSALNDRNEKSGCSTHSSSMEDLSDDVDTSENVLESPTSITDPEGMKEADSLSVEEDHTIDNREKWLIFTCSSETYTPHRIGFKRIKPITFKSRIDPGPTVKERIEEYNRRRQQEHDGVEAEERIDWGNYSLVADRFDKIDHIIDLHGHIIGMALSPDHRYLYVNSRPWPDNYKISNPLEPPPIASEIDIHVIDLRTLKQVGMMRRAHRAFTSNEECFFIFLDTCDQFVASGAEDKHGYVWDRHYGISLAKLPHADVVNSVAFNPRNSQMLVTVSDDNSIKVWRSKAQCRKLGLDTSKMNHGTTLYNLRKQRTFSTLS